MALNTYYHRDWYSTIPNLPGILEEYTPLAKLALHFVGTHCPPAGRAISYTSTLLNTVISAVEQKSIQEKAYNTVRNVAELIGTVAGLRIGLLIHTGMNLAENLYQVFQARDWVERGETLFEIVSNALYFATFYTSSKKDSYVVIGVSLAVQSCWCLYQAIRSAYRVRRWNDVNLLTAIMQGAIGGSYFFKAFLCYKNFTKIRIQVLVLMCSVSNGGLSETDRKLAQGSAFHLDQIRKRYSKDSIVVITSSALPHLETGLIIAEKFGQDPTQVQTDPRMRERIKTGWQLIQDKEQRRADPGYIAYHSLSSVDSWYQYPDPTDLDSESHWSLANRLGSALESHHDKILAHQLPVYVTGSRIIQDFVFQLQMVKANTHLPTAKVFLPGDITVLRMGMDKNENPILELERLPRLQLRTHRIEDLADK